ncbi:MAG: alpha/beta hydrolase [Chitinophagales bacterium]|nr:alpha/beta hydrolase [Chitinophagales bacterium]
MKKNYIYILSLLLLLVQSCSKYEDPGKGMIDKYYHVKVDGIELMTRVTGKENSDVAIIMTHGGPGGSSQVFRLNKGVTDLEKDYKMIYWDQRGSGMTQGNPSKSSMTVSQFAKDLDAIVEFTSQVVGAKNIFLLGHSWGGGLTAYYLTEDPSRQNKLKGYIIANGAYNVTGGLGASRQWIINGALLNIAANKDVAYWKKALQFYDVNKEITADNFLEHASYLGKLKGGRYTNAKVQKVYMPKFELDAFAKNPFFVGYHLTYNGESVYTSFNLTNKLYKIILPTHIVWGSHDGLLPPHKVPNDPVGTALVEDFMANVGTPKENLTYTEYANSAHEPMAEEGDKFTKDIKTFIEKYR